MSRARVLTIAGSDPSGGAGLQADLAVFAAYGCHGTAVVAGLTAQDSLGVRGTHAVTGGFVAAQLDAVFADGSPAACKTGMIASVDSVRAVADAFDLRRNVPLVVDPVVLAGAGMRLVDDDAARGVATLLVPRAALVTPNAPEAAALTGLTVADLDGAIAAARRLVQMGASAALVKGGHVPGASVCDVLVVRDGREPHVFERPRVVTARRVHGTGCALSAAIAGGLARGLVLHDAVELAGRYVHAAIAGAFDAGGGALVLDFSVRVEGMPR